MVEQRCWSRNILCFIVQGMISIKTLSKLAQLRHEGVVLVRTKLGLASKCVSVS